MGLRWQTVEFSARSGRSRAYSAGRAGSSVKRERPHPDPTRPASTVCAGAASAKLPRSMPSECGAKLPARHVSLITPESFARVSPFGPGGQRELRGARSRKETPTRHTKHLGGVLQGPPYPPRGCQTYASKSVSYGSCVVREIVFPIHRAAALLQRAPSRGGPPSRYPWPSEHQPSARLGLLPIRRFPRRSLSIPSPGPQH